MKLVKQIAIAAAAVTTVLVAAVPAFAALSQAPRPAIVATKPAPSTPRCSTPAPTTAAGFSSLFASVDIAEFGAADVGISLPLADGRSVWLFGDTMSWTKFVHSSAIVQDKGCLHVSRGGAQLLPDDTTLAPAAKRFYWIESARVVYGTTIEITAEEIVKTGSGVWDFMHTGYNRTARVNVESNGDLTFQYWTGRFTAQQAAQLGDLRRLPSGQLAYSPRLHPEFPLTSGKTLKTEARNWDDGQTHPIESYRIVFSEV